ncbi:hypothetical protein DPMN_151171 [Dreissena polymorpha]|uniref:Uncharacterized protein n=1 Tax=Dreissena polymorpha TaxID=45954 RepID=A0A9D4FES6_DREPO|nr:hypothetical protein DPMN_151171 [Dreissena polymorpha]
MLTTHDAQRTTHDGQKAITIAHHEHFAHLRGFHDDWAKHVISRVHVIQLTGTIFELNSHIKETNVLNKFRENWAKNVTSGKFTYKCPAHWRPCFSPIWTIFELVRDINKTNGKLTLPGAHVIQLTGIIFELNSHIKETNVLTKFQENWAKHVTLEEKKTPTGSHVFSPIWTIFELVREINKTNVLTNFMMIGQKLKTAPPTGGHVFQRSRTTFELDHHVIKANILTNFELGRDFIGAKLFIKKLTGKCLRTDGRTDIRRTKTGQKSSPEQSGELIKSDQLKMMHIERSLNIVEKLIQTKFHKD